MDKGLRERLEEGRCLYSPLSRWLSSIAEGTTRIAPPTLIVFLLGRSATYTTEEEFDGFIMREHRV